MQFEFTQLKVSCLGCVAPIYAELDDYKDSLKITKSDINVEEKILNIWIDDNNKTDPDVLRATLRGIVQFWLPQEIKNPSVTQQPEQPIPQPRKSAPYSLWLQAAAGLLSGASIMLMMLLGIVPPAWLHDLIIWGGSSLAVILGLPSFRDAINALRPKKKALNMDFLFSLSALASVAITITHLYVPLMPMMVDVALMIFGFRRLGQALEDTLFPQTVAKKKFIDFARDAHPLFNQYKVGDIIHIPAGTCIPLNGKLLSPDANLSFTLHNGRIEPAPYKKNNELYAGMVAHSDLVMEITHDEARSYLHHRDKQLDEAKATRAPIQDLTQLVMNRFIPGVLFTAAALGMTAGFLLNPLIGIKTALYLLVCACPCTLGIITSMAISIGLKKIPPETGVRFNTAKGLQAATHIDTAVFDLNGTLTQNCPRVIGTPSVPAEYFSIIDAMESYTEGTKQQEQHPIAKAICQTVQGTSNKITLTKIKKFRHGIIATDGKNVYQIGNAQFIQPPADKIVKDPGQAQHVIYFMKNGVVQGHFLIEDPLRPDAPQMIHRLLKNKKEVKILTGADQPTAHLYAKRLNIPSSWFVTDCTPKMKFDYIQALKASGRKVAMFGDSANDTNAIAAADLGIAVISPASHPMTSQSADVCLNNSNLLPLMQIFPVGKQTMHQIKQNLGISLVYNTLSLAYVACAMFFMPSLLNPAFGAGMMVVQSLCVFGNALRLKHQEANLQEAADPDDWTAPNQSIENNYVQSKPRSSWHVSYESSEFSASKSHSWHGSVVTEDRTPTSNAIMGLKSFLN